MCRTKPVRAGGLVAVEERGYGVRARCLCPWRVLSPPHSAVESVGTGIEVFELRSITWPGGGCNEGISACYLTVCASRAQLRLIVVDQREAVCNDTQARPPSHWQLVHHVVEDAS